MNSFFPNTDNTLLYLRSCLRFGTERSDRESYPKRPEGWPHETALDLSAEDTLKQSGNCHSVVIVSYNSSSTIGACLHSVLMTLNEGDEVIVVDNASHDDTVRIVEGFLTQTSRLKLIQCQKNTGFSKGCNIGLLESKGRFT
jgi:cellulose synthase/poly-beta-1,6-N-acetylglucosamine synthase-like glycosyltransferase